MVACIAARWLIIARLPSLQEFVIFRKQAKGCGEIEWQTHCLTEMIARASSVHPLCVSARTAAQSEI